jgi:hypothetical protein
VIPTVARLRTPTIAPYALAAMTEIDPATGEEYALDKHGNHPRPRRQSHHGVMSAFVKAHYENYDKDQAPAVLMSDRDHFKTFGVYNTWRAQMEKAMGGTFEWSKVTEPLMRELSERMFDAREYHRTFALGTGSGIRECERN